MTNHVNTGIYVRRPKSFLDLERGEVRQVHLASLYLITFLGLTVPIASPLSCKIGIFL